MDLHRKKKKRSLSLTYDSEVFGFPVEKLWTIVPVSSRSGSNYGFVAAHWPPRRYRANRVPLSHANSPATAVIASRRGLTSNTSWLVFSRTVGVSPLSLSPRNPPFFLPSHVIGRPVEGFSFYIFSPPRTPSVSRRYHFLFLVSTYGRLPPTRRAPRYPARARASMNERYPHPVGALVPPPQRAHSRGDRKSTRHARFIFCPT